MSPIFNNLFSRAVDCYSNALNNFLNKHLYLYIISRHKGIHIHGRIKLRGLPKIDIIEGTSIEIEDNVTLNSRNKGYFINMHSPVKLFIDKPGGQIFIGKNTRIHGTCIHARKKIVIGRNCLIAANTHIIDSNGHDLSFPDVENRIMTNGKVKPVFIEDNVWIGANCMILPGVTIERGSIISAGSVVTESIPGFVIARGNPAKVIKKYTNPQYRFFEDNLDNICV